MGAGVSLSLSRDGDGVHGESICSSFCSLISYPFPREHGFYVGSVPLSREQVYYGRYLLEGVSLSANLLSPIYYGFDSDFFAREPVYPSQNGKVVYGGSIPSSFRAIEVTSRPKKGSTRDSKAVAGSDDANIAGKAIIVALNADLMDTDLSGIIPSRSKGESRLILLILGCTSVDLILPTIHADLVFTVLSRASTNSEQFDDYREVG